MCRIAAESQIPRLIYRRHCCQSAGEPTGIRPLIIPRIYFPVVNRVENWAPISLEQPVPAGDLRKSTIIPPRRPLLHRHVVVSPRSAPAGPTPDVIVVRKKIAIARTESIGDEITARNHCYTTIIAIQLEQLVAIIEKCRHGEYIIFENDSFRLMIKEPVNPAGHTHFTAKILVPEKSVDLAKASQQRSRCCEPSWQRCTSDRLAGLGPSAATYNLGGRASRMASNTRRVVSGRFKYQK